MPHYLFQKKVPLQVSDCMAMAISENLNLRWDDFAANLSSALNNLRGDENFTDLTLVCADQQVEVHKVVLASSSKFFWRVLKKIKHSHPLIYLKGVKFKDLEAVLSFMYLGQVYLAQEDLDSFLALAEELEVNGLTLGEKVSKANSNRLAMLDTQNSKFEFRQKRIQLDIWFKIGNAKFNSNNQKNCGDSIQYSGNY